MLRKVFVGLIGLGMFASAQAYAAYDVASDPGTGNTQATQQAAPIASSQTASIISGNIGGSINVGGGTGGFSPGGVGGGGGFSGGGGSSGGFTGGGTGSGNRNFMSSRESGRSGGAGDKRWGAWIQGAYTYIDNSQVGVQFDGDVYNLVGAVDYLVNDRMVAGLAFGYETLDLDMKFQRGTLKSDGFMLAPYMGIALNNTWTVDAMAGYTWLNYDTTRNSSAVKGTYDAERWFAAANLTGNYPVNRFRIMPSVGVLYLEEKSDAYTETGTGAAGVLGNTVKLGRLSAGGKVGYVFESAMPYLKLMGDYDWEHPDAAPIGNGTFTHAEDWGGRIGFGLDIFSKGAWAGNIEASYLSLGKEDLDVYSISARISTRF